MEQTRHAWLIWQYKPIAVFYFYFCQFYSTVQKKWERTSPKFDEIFELRTSVSEENSATFRRMYCPGLCEISEATGVEPNAKFRRTFARTKDEIRPTSLLLLLHSTVAKQSRKILCFNFKKA